MTTYVITSKCLTQVKGLKSIPTNKLDFIKNLCEVKMKKKFININLDKVIVKEDGEEGEFLIVQKGRGGRWYRKLMNKNFYEVNMNKVNS